MVLHGFPGHMQIYQPAARPGLPFPTDLPPLLFTLLHTLTELILVFSQRCAMLSCSLHCVHVVSWPGILCPLLSFSSWFFLLSLCTAARAGFPPAPENLRGLLLLPGHSCLPPPSPLPCGIQGCTVAWLLSAWAPHAMAQTCAGPSLHSLRHSLNGAFPTHNPERFKNRYVELKGYNQYVNMYFLKKCYSNNFDCYYVFYSL